MGGNDCNFNWKEIAKDSYKEYFPNVNKEQYMENLYKIFNLFNYYKIKAIALNLTPLHAEKFFNYLGNEEEMKNILLWSRV